METGGSKARRIAVNDPSRGTRASYSVHDGQVSGDPAPAVAWCLDSARHREPYRTARLIIAVSGKYLAAGQREAGIGGLTRYDVW